MTVKKHLEPVFVKLFVETRTAGAGTAISRIRPLQPQFGNQSRFHAVPRALTTLRIHAHVGRGWHLQIHESVTVIPSMFVHSIETSAARKYWPTQLPAVGGFRSLLAVA